MRKTPFIKKMGVPCRDTPISFKVQRKQQKKAYQTITRKSSGKITAPEECLWDCVKRGEERL